MPSVSIESKGGSEDHDPGPAGRRVIRNRRLRYLETHPEYLDAFLPGLRPTQSPPTSQPATNTGRGTEGERIGGPISANLLDAYDLDCRIGQRREEAEERARQAAREEEWDTDEDDDEDEDGDRVTADLGGDDLRDKRATLVEAFLAGEDATFDYSTVDPDESLDDLARLTQEAQERFFDEDEPDTEGVPDGSNSLYGQTGIQDY